MKNFPKLNSNDLLEMALRSRHNAIVLKDSAFKLMKKKNSKNHGLFLYYNASEEMQKALFCMFAHRRIMKPSQLESIFKTHATRLFYSK